MSQAEAGEDEDEDDVSMVVPVQEDAAEDETGTGHLKAGWYPARIQWQMGPKSFLKVSSLSFILPFSNSFLHLLLKVPLPAPPKSRGKKTDTDDAENAKEPTMDESLKKVEALGPQV